MEKFKKILIVSSWSPPAIGGPQNLFNILRDFLGKFFMLTSFYNLKNASPQRDKWLSGEYVFFDNPSANKENFFELLDAEPHKKSVVIRVFKRFNIIKPIANYFYRVLVLLKQIKGFVSTGLKIVRNNDIDVIMGISDNGPALIASYIIHRVTRKSLYIYLFDLYRGNIFPTQFVEGALARIIEPKLFSYAEKVIVTNEGTRDFYIKRYGDQVRSKIVVVHNSVFPEPYFPYFKSGASRNKNFEIVFTGRVYWAQLQSLKNLIEAVKRLNNKDIQIVIYSPNKIDYLTRVGINEGSNVKITSAFSDEMPAIQSRADVLFLPLSWETKSPDIINTATPGKLTDYLIAGKPILIHAPSSTFLSSYAQEGGFAMVVDENNVDKLKEAIIKLMSDKELRSSLVVNAQKTFFANHDANKTSKLFQSLLLK